MFQDLAGFERIAVTGPQRSGTTFAARAIASDTGHRYVDEFEFDVFDVGKWLRLVFSGEPVVVQCPHMLRYLVDLRSPEVFVVLMRRPLDDIARSAERIGWNEMDDGAARELALFGRSEGDPAALKYEYWDGNPKPPAYREVDYASLRQHPSYLDADQRQGFEAKQTGPGADVDEQDVPSRPRRGLLSRFTRDGGTAGPVS